MGPPFRMDPGIHDQSDRAEKFALQTSEIAERIALVPTRLLRQPFRVERPALVIRGKRNDFSELRQAL